MHVGKFYGVLNGRWWALFQHSAAKKTDAGSLQEAKWGNGYYVWLKSERSGSQSIWTVNRAMWSVGTRLVLRIWSFTVVNRSWGTWSDRLGNVTEINQPLRAGRKPCRSTLRWLTTPSYQTTGNETQSPDSSAPVDESLGLFFILPCRTRCTSFSNKFGALNQKGVWYMIL